jgi:hypothetical protein
MAHPNVNGAVSPCRQCGLSHRNSVHTNAEQFGFHPWEQPEDDSGIELTSDIGIGGDSSTDIGSDSVTDTVVYTNMESALLSEAIRDLSRAALIVKRERDQLLSALIELVDATPTSCDDNRLNEAQRNAENVIRLVTGVRG